MRLHSWALPTRTFQQVLFGKSDGTTGVDDNFAARGFNNIGVWILGRNMFAPSRGPWPDDGWKGWWGDTPYHTPVFALTHHARAPIEMNGGTTFHFVTDGIHATLDRAREAANGKDIRIGGGVAVVRQYSVRIVRRNPLQGSGTIAQPSQADRIVRIKLRPAWTEFDYGPADRLR